MKHRILCGVKLRTPKATAEIAEKCSPDALQLGLKIVQECAEKANFVKEARQAVVYITISIRHAMSMSSLQIFPPFITGHPEIPRRTPSLHGQPIRPVQHVFPSRTA